MEPSVVNGWEGGRGARPESVTGSLIRRRNRPGESAPSRFTNTQNAGVDEGGIVKLMATTWLFAPRAFVALAVGDGA